MRKSGGQRVDLQSLRYLRGVIPPGHRLRDPDRRQQILLQGRQYRIGPDLCSRIAAGIVTARKSETCDTDSKDSGKARQFRAIDLAAVHERAPRPRVRVQPAVTEYTSRMATTIAESVTPIGTTAV